MNNRTIRGAAAVAALSLLLSGCSFFQKTPEPQETEEKTMYLVDDLPREEPMLIQEVPSIFDEPLDNIVQTMAADRVVAPSTSSSSSSSSSSSTRAASTVSASDEAKSVWISYLELDGLLKGKTAAQFTQNIGKVYDNVKSFGLNTVIVQVRPFADAIYPSEYFPWSYLCTGTEGKNPGFDPLAILIQEAHDRGLRFEAWLNPYRVRNAGSGISLSADNTAGQWLNANNGSVHKASNGLIVYNPASRRAQELIVNGVREIVRNYNVDGIHIDDYFYPTTGTSFDTTFDAASYKTYQQSGGNLSLADWRRGNVDVLIRTMYTAIKEENPSVVFGISPQSSVSNNYNQMYLDIEKVLSTKGYCDYVCPQIYFGYQNDVQPFQKTLQTWNDMIKVDGIQLYVGIASYKLGKADSWAGSGSAEWQNNQDIMARQLTSSRGMEHYGGVVLYRYDSIFNPDASVRSHIAAECDNLSKIL